MRSAVWPGLPSSSQLLVSYKPAAAAAAAAAALFKPSPVHSWGCSVSNLCGTQLPVNPGRLAVVTISRSASKRGTERMSSGQGCIRTCTHPAEVYQVQQLLASLPVSRVRSRDQPHSVTRGGSWIYLMLFFVFFFLISLWAGFCGETGQPQSVSLAAILIYRARAAFSRRVDPSLWWAAGVIVKGISHDELFPRYHVGASTRELDVMDAVFL